MAGDPPARIDRATLERIIQRAAELQTGTRDIGDNLSPDEVIKLGREVGIPEGYLQQAMLEESTRVELPGKGGFWSRVIGPTMLAAQRVIQGEPGDIEAALLRYMEEHELLAIQRQQSGRISWEPLGGFQAALRRSTAMLGGGKRPFMLAQADSVSATIVRLEPGYCNVVLTADLDKRRAGYLGGTLTLVGASVAAAAAIAVMSPFILVALAPLPFGLGLGYLVTRRYRPVAERAQLGLERVLDNLERGSVKPAHQLPPPTTGLIGNIADEIRKALKPR
ncbi:MAG TPA: hypothetical protein VGP80_06450 [Gemmatimonadales bacterium]|nr:hypothetical protein [Gemmatimonadales bacterium]